MPKLKKKLQQRSVRSLADITGLELTGWATHGPAIAGLAGDSRGRLLPAGVHRVGPSSRIVWPSWGAFFELYEGVRDEFLARQRPHMRKPAVETLYQGWRAGKDPEKIVDEIGRESESDARRILKLLDPEPAPANRRRQQ